MTWQRRRWLLIRASDLRLFRFMKWIARGTPSSARSLHTPEEQWALLEDEITRCLAREREAKREPARESLDCP